MVVVMFLRLPPIVARQDLIFHTYGALVEVDALVRQRYVEELDDDRLAVGAIRGMLRELDPYSRYYTAEELAAASRRIEGHYVGIGVEVGMVDGQPTVITPLEGGPAAEAGVQPGDLILGIEGHDVRRLGVIDIEEQLQGSAGTSVRITLRHADAEEPTELVMERRSIDIETVCGFVQRVDGARDYLIDPGNAIAYIRLNRFNDTTPRNFDAALAAIRASNAKALVLDLRFNPGGILPAAVAVANRFVDEGGIVSTITRRGVETDYAATASRTDTSLPLALLINGSTASAAEIVAGALQDHKRAIVVGERSFGKGSVQGMLRLTNHEAAVKLTIAYYRLPSGRLIHRGLSTVDPDDWGIKPDVPVTLSRDERQALQKIRFGRNADARSADNTLAIDRQLATAVDLLRKELRPNETGSSGK